MQRRSLIHTMWVQVFAFAITVAPFGVQMQVRQVERVPLPSMEWIGAFDKPGGEQRPGCLEKEEMNVGKEDSLYTAFAMSALAGSDVDSAMLNRTREESITARK